jgi:hypothetical protein
MARLPSYCYLIQQIGGDVILFEDGSERQIVRFDPSDGNAVTSALDVIRDSELGEEDRCYAQFWTGYFHAYSDRNPEVARETFITEDEGTGMVTVTTVDGAEVVRFSAADQDSAAKAQFAIHLSSLDLDQQVRAHFWSGYFYAHGSERF